MMQFPPTFSTHSPNNFISFSIFSDDMIMKEMEHHLDSEPKLAIEERELVIHFPTNKPPGFTQGK